MAWKWAAASIIGTSHIRSGASLEDAYTVSAIGGDYLVAIVSDGAGSAKFGAAGAWLTCRRLKVCFREWLSEHADLPSDEILLEWIDEIRDRIASAAEAREVAPRQFAATLATLLISPDEIVALHIGDAAIVGRRETEWEVICWPENGEYASTTYFVTDDPEPRLGIKRLSRDHDAFALFSDGVGDLALQHLEQQAHAKFFVPMFAPIDAANGSGRLIELSEKLGEFLACSSVCDRTDDDKTLILITGG